MNTTTISTQELRKDMPKIRRGLARGKSYILIHRSKPIAEMKPLVGENKTADFVKALLEVRDRISFRSEKSAVELVREERD